MTESNLILREFGHTTVATTDENDDSNTINNALDLYLPLYQKTSIDYSFLFKNVTLTAQVIPQFSDQYTSTFALPSDYLRLKQVYQNFTFEIREPYVLSNSPSFVMDYFAFNPNYATFPVHFIDCFIYFCAIKLCMGMTRQQNIMMGLMKAFDAAQLQASTVEFRSRSGMRTQLNPNSLTASSILAQ